MSKIYLFCDFTKNLCSVVNFKVLHVCDIQYTKCNHQCFHPCYPELHPQTCVVLHHSWFWRFCLPLLKTIELFINIVNFCYKFGYVFIGKISDLLIIVIFSTQYFKFYYLFFYQRKFLLC